MQAVAAGALALVLAQVLGAAAEPQMALLVQVLRQQLHQIQAAVAAVHLSVMLAQAAQVLSILDTGSNDGTFCKIG